MKYIFKNKIVDYGKDISDSVTVSDNYDDRFKCHVKISDEQEQFYSNNPNASIYEIWNMKLNEVVEPVQPTADEQRKAAYSMEKVITWQDEQLTCDECLQRLSKYRELNDIRHGELQVLYVDAINFIKNKYC